MNKTEGSINTQFHRVLFPTDLSEVSLSGLEKATQLAREIDAKLCFVFVQYPALPEEAMIGLTEGKKGEFVKLRPTDNAVGFEHHFLIGNAGPEIVKATKKADLCVMSTHGRSGIKRLLLGSVAEYVLRNAQCPVVLLKGFSVASSGENEELSAAPQFATEVMHQVAPIRPNDQLEDVLSQLRRRGETAAPVANDFGRCIGILTLTDVEKYLALKTRREEGDKSVIPEMFETDKYGHVRCQNHDFGQVRRHMSTDLVSIRNSDSIQDALAAFESNPQIHHLVVLDEDDRPVGMLNLKQLVPSAGVRFIENGTS